jgi:hypothetical protein
MIGIETDLEVTLNAEDVRQAHRQRLMDGATKGFAISQERVPEDRGTLRQSGFPPEWRGTEIVYGYTTEYAEDMEFGTDPFEPKTQPLIDWAQRIGKSAGFGAWVANEKIPQEGIAAQPYLRPSAEAAKAWWDNHGLGEYLE